MTGESVPKKDEWNVRLVRKIVMGDADARGYREVLLDASEKSNVFVRQDAKIRVAANTNLVINGKRVENPQDCNQQ